MHKGPRRLFFQPGDDPVDITAERMARPAFRRLVEAFGGTWPTDGSSEHRLQRLVRFSEMRHHREGGPRLDIGDVGEPERESYSLVPDTADALGPIDQAPPSRIDLHYIVILR